MPGSDIVVEPGSEYFFFIFWFVLRDRARKADAPRGFPKVPEFDATTAAAGPSTTDGRGELGLEFVALRGLARESSSR